MPMKVKKIMIINFINNTSESIDNFKNILERIATKTEVNLTLTQNFEIAVIFCENAEIKSLNFEFRGINQPTDVLSFQHDFQFEMLEDELGDIFINLDFAELQAEKYQHSLKREVGFLFVHGLLHLLGYDHKTASEEAEMFALQDNILEGIISREKV